MTFEHPKIEPNSLRAMAYEVLNVVYSGTVTAEKDISTRQVEKHIIDEWLYVQDLEDKALEKQFKTPSPDREVTYNCEKLTETKDFYCSCSKSNWSVKKIEVPKMISYKDSPYIRFVGILDDEGITKFVKASSVSDLDYMSKKVKKPIWLSMSENIYVALPPEYSMICEVSVIGVPKNPFDFMGLCYDPWSATPPISEEHRVLIKNRAVDFFSKFLATAQNKDLLNNSSEGNRVVQK